jgi:uncharacterized protein (TIGR03435 family)
VSALTLKDYISMAYGLKLYQISGADWIAKDRFDISATLPAGSLPSQVPAMMQTLLEDRFDLKTHREQKEFPVYVLLAAASGLKIKELPLDLYPEKADAGAPQTFTRTGSGQGVSANLGQGSSFNFANNKFEAKKLTMAALAATLERFLDRPILDMTQLKSAYDVSLDLTPEDYRLMLIRAAVAAGLVLSPNVLRVLDGSPTPSSLFDGLQKVGLKLEARKAPLDLLVVDSARKTPTEN